MPPAVSERPGHLRQVKASLSRFGRSSLKQRELLQTRKSRKTGKRVKLKGRFVFSTTEVLEIAREAEEATAAEKGRERLRKRSVSVEIAQDAESMLAVVSSDSESDCIVVANMR